MVHLVFKVLSCYQGIQQFPATIDHDMDFTYQTHHLAIKGEKTREPTTATSKIFVIIEGLPKVVN
jgi:hypothetical protein